MPRRICILDRIVISITIAIKRLWIHRVRNDGIDTCKATDFWRMPPGPHVHQLNVIVMLVAGKTSVTHRRVRLRLRPMIAIKRPFLPTTLPSPTEFNGRFCQQKMASRMTRSGADFLTVHYIDFYTFVSLDQLINLDHQFSISSSSPQSRK